MRLIDHLDSLAGLNIVSLMMLTAMNLLTQRDIAEINFEIVYAEYDTHVQGLGAADESLNRFVYSKGTRCFVFSFFFFLFSFFFLVFFSFVYLVLT
jgi:hypothetical protein